MTGKWTFGVHNRTLHTRTQEKGSVEKGPHRRLFWACLCVSSESVGWWGPATGLGALSVAVHAWDLLKEVIIIFITSIIDGPR